MEKKPDQRSILTGKWYTVFDENGNAVEVYFDDSYRKLLGFETEQEYANAKKTWKHSIHPDDQARLNAVMADCLARHPEGRDFELEYRMKTRWGYRWFHDFGHCTRREDGSVVRCDGLIIDIQENKDNELRKSHEALLKEVLDYIVNHDDDPIELLSQFAEKIRVLLDCDQVIYRDLEETRIMVNSPAIADTWSVPIDFCRQCQHFDAHHPMYRDGYTEMDNCQEGWQGIPVYEKCPIKSSLTRIVYCNGQVAGYLAIHYVQKYHHFSPFEEKTLEDFVRNLSLILSKYETNRELKAVQEKKHNELVENNQRVMALEDNLESLYDVELESGKYAGYVKGDFYQSNVADKLLPEGDYFEDLRGNIDAVIYPEDRDTLFEVLSRESLRKALAKTDRIEHFYRLFVGGVPVWFKIRVVYKDLDHRNIIIGVFNASQELEAQQIAQQREQIAEQATFTNFFLETYVSAYYVNLDTLSCKTYKRTSRLDDEYPIISNYFESIKDYISRDVHPDDRDSLLEDVTPERMREILKNQFEYTHIFRDISEGVEKTYRMQVIRGGEDNHAAFGFVDITDEISEQNRKLKEAEETKKLVDSIAAEYNMAWIVNMADDSFRNLRMDDDVVGSKENFRNFSEAKRFFLDKVCHPADKKRMTVEMDYDNIRTRLEGKRSFDVEYRAVINGTTIWHEMNITSITGDNVAIGFVKRDLTIVKRHLSDKKFDEYLALYTVDLDTEMVKPIKPSSDSKVIEDAQSIPFRQAMQMLASRMEGEAREFFEQISDIEYMRQDYATSDKKSFAYKTPQGKWFDCSCYVISRHEDGAPSMCALGYSYSDTLAAEKNEMQQQIRQDMEIISGLANEYHALYYVNIREGFFKIYSIDEERFPEAKQMVGGGGNPADVFKNFGASPLIHPDDKHKFMELDVPTILTKLAHSKKFTTRYRRKFKDEYLWCEMEFIKYEDIDEPANIMAVGFAERDAEIHKEMKQRQELEDAYKMAKTASEAKSNFLFNMSHDIRTPLNAITGFTAMAKKNAGNTEQVLDYLGKIDVSGQQLLMLINQVLEMARIESGKIEFNEHPVNIKERFDVMVTVLSEQASVHGLEFHSSLDDLKHPNVFADDARMGQVTLNIAGNAMKYTPEGGRIDFKIREISPRREGYATMVFTVADTGIGMSKEYLKTLYEPFTRENTSTVSQIQGTGLGLSIVKSLVDLAGGRIDVESELGKGTRFDITMDFKINDQEVQVVETKTDLSSFKLEGKRVLLVEDNEMNREIARFILEEKGIVVEEADDGDVAVDRIMELATEGQYNYFDVILMDVQMPRMDGFEATARIRKILDPLVVHIPIIALSANAFEEDRKKSRKAGMDDHIAKPINVDELWTTLARFL